MSAPAAPSVRHHLASALGRGLFGAAMMIFGVQHFIYAAFVDRLMQEWMPFRSFWTYFTGLALLAAGAAIAGGAMARTAATLLGLMIFVFFLLVHVPQVVLLPQDPHQITYLTQAWTFSGIALMMAGAVRQGTWPSDAATATLVALGRMMVAIGWMVLGVRQLLGLPFVHGLVPAWLPSPVFWQMLAGVVLILAGVGVAVRRERLAAAPLAVLLLLFLLGHHLPSLAAAPRQGDWGAACKDAILAGGALVMMMGRRHGQPHRP